MEKKKYNKPEVCHTRLDSSINILLVSCLPADYPCNGQEGTTGLEGEPVVNGFLNPFKWLK
jgi:hypothetical protein